MLTNLGQKMVPLKSSWYCMWVRAVIASVVEVKATVPFNYLTPGSIFTKGTLLLPLGGIVDVEIPWAIWPSSPKEGHDLDWAFTYCHQGLQVELLVSVVVCSAVFQCMFSTVVCCIQPLLMCQKGWVVSTTQPDQINSLLTRKEWLRWVDVGRSCKHLSVFLEWTVSNIYKYEYTFGAWLEVGKVGETTIFVNEIK